jgi:hypothetical protein
MPINDHDMTADRPSQWRLGTVISPVLGSIGVPPVGRLNLRTAETAMLPSVELKRQQYHFFAIGEILWTAGNGYGFDW